MNYNVFDSEKHLNPPYQGSLSEVVNMKIVRLLVFAIANLLALNVSATLLFAKAPTTPKILFASSRDGNREVYIMNPDGSEQVNLTQHPADDQQAIWSPTGEQILFASNRGHKVFGSWDLYLMDPDGKNVRRVFKKETFRNTPTWSPDGKQFAYKNSDWDAGESHIYIATLGEQEEERIAEGFDPAWSPDGTQLAYVIYILDARRVALIDLHTRKQERLLPRKATSWQNGPSWSATGNKLAFSWNKNPLPPNHRPGQDRFPPEWEKKETIYIVNRDGTDLQQLVDEAGHKAVNSVLSPDGNEVLYTQELNGYFQVFKVNVNSGIVTQLTHIVDLRLLQANAGGDWFDPAYALPVSPQPHLLTTTWGIVKQR